MRISILLVDSPLRVLAHAMREVDAEVRRQIGAATKGAAQPIWTEETRGRAQTRLQSRLADSARVGVTAQNVFLRAGAVGRLSSGTSIREVAKATEFGAPAASLVSTRSRKGKAYRRRLGPAFGPVRRQGNIAYPAARESIPRFASLWVQTAIRTIHETVERI